MIFRIIVVIAIIIFDSYLYFNDGRSITKKDLTESESKYLTVIEIYSFFSPLILGWLLVYFFEH